MKKLTDARADVHCRLTLEEAQRLRELAQKEDRSVSYLMARILREWIAKQHKEAR
jgi:predicted transcriptional regulator